MCFQKGFSTVNDMDWNIFTTSLKKQSSSSKYKNQKSTYCLDLNRYLHLWCVASWCINHIKSVKMDPSHCFSSYVLVYQVANKQFELPWVWRFFSVIQNAFCVDGTNVHCADACNVSRNFCYLLAKQTTANGYIAGIIVIMGVWCRGHGQGCPISFPFAWACVQQPGH